MEPNIVVQNKIGRTVLGELQQPIIDMRGVGQLTLCLVEGDARNPAPTVMVIAPDNTGTYVMQMSLEDYVTSARKLHQISKERWSVSIMEAAAEGLDREAKRKFVAHIKSYLDGLLEE